MQGACWHVQAHVNTPGMNHQGAALRTCYWRVVGKADGALKEGNIRVRETFKGRESSTGRLYEGEGNVEGKEDVKGRKY
jgi:hypothetical protein